MSHQSTLLESLASLPIYFTNDETFGKMEQFIDNCGDTDAYMKFETSFKQFSTEINGGFNNLGLLLTLKDQRRETLSALPSSHKEQLMTFIKEYYKVNKDEIDGLISKTTRSYWLCTIL